MIKTNIKLLVAIKERGLKQKDICQLLGVSAPLLSEVISGKRNLDEEFKNRLAQILNATASELFSAVEPPAPASLGTIKPRVGGMPQQKIG